MKNSQVSVIDDRPKITYRLLMCNTCLGNTVHQITDIYTTVFYACFTCDGEVDVVKASYPQPGGK